MHHLVPAELSFEGVPKIVMKYKSQTRLISAFILWLFLNCCRSAQASAGINCFPRATWKSLRENEAVTLSSLFSWMSKDTRFHTATPGFISTTLGFAAAPVFKMKMWNCQDSGLMRQLVEELLVLYSKCFIAFWGCKSLNWVTAFLKDVFLLLQVQHIACLSLGICLVLGWITEII